MDQSNVNTFWTSIWTKNSVFNVNTFQTSIWTKKGLSMINDFQDVVLAKILHTKDPLGDPKRAIFH